MGPGVLICVFLWVLFWGSWDGRLSAAAKRRESRRMARAGRADGRLTFAIRVLSTALAGGQQLKDANHDGGVPGYF